jgi:hypothetical protein
MRSKHEGDHDKQTGGNKERQKEGNNDRQQTDK